jgi:hypothetical protein
MIETIDTNYNVVLIRNTDAARDMYRVGDTFSVPGRYRRCSLRWMKFEGLEIKNIDFQLWCMRLHFDWSEWKENHPEPDRSVDFVKPKNFKF